ncbi:MAG: ferrochelatase [Pseudomonadota bacterium]
MRYLQEPEFRHGTATRPGVLMINLGTPDAPTAPALRRYLRQFLSDPRVVEIPRPIWWPILNGIILNVRPKKSAAKYASVWMKEGSPLKVHTERQAALLKGWIGERTGQDIAVEYAMRYGSPSIAAGLDTLKAAGCDRILLLPMYPQYAASTTASANDAAFAHLQKTRNAPALRTIRHYHDDPGYIGALAASVREYWRQNERPDVLVMSFHGLPRYTLDKGDPYHCECQKTGRLLAEALGLSDEQYRITFQSRFGRAEWLKPYTDKTLAELARRGVRHVQTVCPGFPADCLETLEEIAMEGKETFLNAGGRTYAYIPALNESPRWIDALGEIALANLGGWLVTGADSSAQKSALDATARRALQMGAKA